ncbi:hypothetical protein COU18_02190 [Candidatus Kaiserbacteria bacterium CG10_big_fil_rev_8_21_14_0_10_51_14]|uniref:Uncharacterized protein n=1 Tax=Candidatus Kaiserbacteria bacterium CG10_big_fil_rev_8_21_14_0_10_51_14 TaxID=1974610 RepID=A0A2H0UBV2_9BACT|nr:MAG: hypothetical protein COU18_02190 [Candidatus Kaiserbacteria bacterium CG10_big_fil_rev_8_21_14_0_10_51_14]
MVRSITHSRSAILLVILLIVAFALPSTVGAQESESQVRAAVRAELMKDPRTAGFSEAQIDAMVDILVGEAQKNNLTASDITWQPQGDTFNVQNSSSEGGVVSETCDSPRFLCLFSEAFGFVGPKTLIPLLLFQAASMGMVWIFAEALYRHRMRMYPPISAETPTSM